MQCFNWHCPKWTFVKFIFVACAALVYFIAPSQVSEFKSSSWTKVADFGGGKRDDGCAFSINGFGYYGLGIDDNYQLRSDWWRYNPASDEWKEIESIPGDPRQYATIIQTDSNIFLVGGIGEGVYFNEVFKFLPKSEQWIRIADAPFAARAAAFSFAIGNKAYFGTGRNDSLRFNDFWSFDTRTERWLQLEDLPFGPRDEMTAFDALNHGYLLAGRDSATNFSDVWKFDPVGEVWTQMPNFDHEMRTYSATVGVGTGVILCGGMTATNDLNNPQSLSNTALYFDANSKTWIKLKDFPVRLRGLDGFRINNSVYFCNGLTHGFSRLNTVYRLDFTIDPALPICLIYPIPARDNLIVYLLQNLDQPAEEYTLQIYDVFGRTWMHRKFQMRESSIEFPLDELANGNYWVRLANDQFDITRHIVITK